MTDAAKLKFIEDMILKLFKKSFTLKPTDVLLDLSIDSLDTVELQMCYEETTGHEITTDVAVSTVSDLMSVMR